MIVSSTRVYFIFGVGFALSVLFFWAMREPLFVELTAVGIHVFFVCLPLSMSNFSFRGQGVLRTSRYGERLFVDLLTDSKRTNKNQRVSCTPYRKEVLLQNNAKLK